MTILFDLIYIIAAVFYLPAFLFKGKHRAGFAERLGIYPAAFREQLQKGKPVIWLHAVSVGEMKAAAPLIEQLRLQCPRTRLLLSTVTPTGNAVARKLAQDEDKVIYLPFDLSWVVKKVLNIVNPKAFLIMETELWPNMIRQAWKKDIKLAVINGRISNRALPHYKKAVLFFKPVLRKISLFCMQTRIDAERIISLGADASRVQVVGNLKFDQAALDGSKGTIDIGLREEERLIVAGSTHAHEEEIVVRVFCRLKERHPHIRLLLGPRHTYRAADIIRIIENQGLSAVLISHLQQGKAQAGDKDVFILDIMGVLSGLYQLADIVFVGGSLIPHGGQNPIEPAQAAKPIIFGRHMFNFAEVAKMFLDNHAAVSVNDEEELYRSFNDLLQNTQKREALAQAAKKLVTDNRGSVQRVLKLLQDENFLCGAD